MDPMRLPEALRSMKVWCLQATSPGVLDRGTHMSPDVVPRNLQTVDSDQELDRKVGLMAAAFPNPFVS